MPTQKLKQLLQRPAENESRCEPEKMERTKNPERIEDGRIVVGTPLKYFYPYFVVLFR